MEKKSKFSMLVKSAAWALSYYAAQLVGVALVTAIAAISGYFTFDMYTAYLENIATNTVPEEIMRLISDISNYAFIVAFIPYAIYAFIKHKKGTTVIRKEPLKEITFTIFKGLTLSLCVSLFLIGAIVILPESITDSYTNLMNTLVNGNHIIIMCLAVGILAPIIEEIVFRFGIQRNLEQAFSEKVSLIIQALIFGIIHGNLIQSSYAFLLGIALGYSYNKSNKNLLIPILLHISINMSSCILSIFEIESFIGLPIGIIVFAIITCVLSKIDKKKSA